MIRSVEYESSHLIAQLKKELLSARRLAEDIANNCPAMTILLNRDKECVWADRQWLAFTGHSLEQELGTGWQYSIHPDERDAYLQLLEPEYASREGSMECRMRRHDGEYRSILCKKSPHYDADDTVIGYVCCRQDTTEHRENEKRHADFMRVVARLSNEFINTPASEIMDAMTAALGIVGEYCGADSVSVWRHDWDRKVALREYGWKRDGYSPPRNALQAMPTESIQYNLARQAAGSVYYLDDCKLGNALGKHLAALLSEHTIGFFPLMTGNCVYGNLVFVMKKEKNRFNVAEVSAVTIFAEMVMNVILRKRQEEDLRRLNENYRMILDATTDGVGMFSRDGTVLAANAHMADRLCSNPREAVGKGLGEFFAFDGVSARRIEMLAKAYDTGEPVLFEDSYDGAVYYNRLHPVIREGSVTAVTVFSTDITARRTAEQEALKLAESQARLKIVTDFFTNISHEFRTPLTIILNAIEMSEMRVKGIVCDGQTRILRNLSIMRQNAHRLLRLIGNLLDVTKVDAGYLQLNNQDLDVARWLEKLISSVEDFAAARGITASFRNTSRERSMQMDGDKLDRIMLNLLSNAIKHTGRGGHIDVLLADGQDCIRITVADDGEGIPEDKKELIFDRFRQVNTSLTRASEGTGIGLALTKALVELMNGRIWFDSKVGEGTRFYVELPALPSSEKKMTFIDGLALNRKVEMEFSDIL